MLWCGQYREPVQDEKHLNRLPIKLPATISQAAISASERSPRQPHFRGENTRSDNITRSIFWELCRRSPKKLGQPKSKPNLTGKRGKTVCRAYGLHSA